LTTLKLGEASEEEVMKSCIDVVLKLNSSASFCEDVTLNPDDFTACRISGGITNGLFRITSEKNGIVGAKQLLVRVFGAEGMIDRDVETSVYAGLCDAKIAAPTGHLARFGNGRVEGWLEGFAPLSVPDLSKREIYLGVAGEMAKLHKFTVPADSGAGKSPQMWNDMKTWGEQAKKSIADVGSGFKNEETDRPRAEALYVDKIFTQTDYLKTVIKDDSPIAFCHNDMLAGNIMTEGSTGQIQLIDFEYGTTNFVAFDIANHFNEWAGGTDNGKPDYSLLPTKEQKEEFVAEYVKVRGDASLKVDELVEEVDRFMWVNNIYWGMWGGT